MLFFPWKAQLRGILGVHTGKKGNSGSLIKATGVHNPLATPVRAIPGTTMSATPEKKIDEFGDSYKRSQNEVLFNTREAVLKEAGEVCFFFGVKKSNTLGR